MAQDRTTSAATVLAGQSDGDARAFLVVYLPQGAETRTRVIALDNDFEHVFGRMAGNSVVLDYEPVSRRHAKLVRHDTEIYVEDLDSRNGTFVNGIRISEPTLLSAGDEIAIGPMTAIVGVTGQGNRQTRVVSATDFEERLAAELDRSARYRRPVGIMMVRLDGSSDEIGEGLGVLARSLRRMDTLAGYGPNEFAALIPECGFADTEQAARRLIYDTEGLDLKVSIGVAAAPQDATEANALLSRARTALRVARSSSQGKAVSGASRAQESSSTGTVIQDRLMKRVYALARKVAATPMTVLILGETGVGKEVVANSIHNFSDRAGKPFVALNCSALPESLLESELFGHERGAFTGADKRKIGYFEAAEGGTIFLDEIGEMPPGVQAKLLRVLEQRTVTRVGANTPVPVDVRVVCATNRDLETEIKRGRFREDLYFRLSAFTIVIPPLRNRESEIVALANHFAREFARELNQSPPQFTDAAKQLMEQYSWPGNVRELRNAVERAVVLCGGAVVDVDLLPDRVTSGVQGSNRDRDDVRAKVADVEKQAVVSALESCGQNQTKAAKALGISRFALIRLMNKYDLKRKPRTRH